MAESGDDEDQLPPENENEYSSDEFDYDYDEVIETEAFIQYNAAIGPNIIVSKANSRKNTTTPRYATSAVKKAISQRRARTGTPGSARRSQTFLKKSGKPVTEGKLRNEFQKLSLGMDFVFPGSRGPTPLTRGRSTNASTVRTAGSRTSLAIKGPSKPRQESVVQQRLNSARKIQMKDMMSQFRLLENANYTLSVENRTLRTVQHRHEIALRKYEGLESDFPRLLEHHANEVHSLQRGFRKAQVQAREHEEKIRGLNMKILNLGKEKNRLQALVGLNQLEERHTLMKQVQQLQEQLAEAEKKGSEYRRRFELLEKTQKKQFSEMRLKIRTSNNRLFEAEAEIDRQKDVLRQKDKVINYLRMRNSRHTVLEPPIVRKMSDADMSGYKKSHLKMTTSQKQQHLVESEEPRNPPSRSHYPQHRTQIRNTQFANQNEKKRDQRLQPPPRRMPRIVQIQREEDDNYSVAGSGPSDLHSISSCDSRAHLDTVRSGDMDVSRGSMSPSYSEENLDIWTDRQQQHYGGHGDATFTEEENDRFDYLESGQGYLQYSESIQSRAYSASDINTLRGCNSELALPSMGVIEPTPQMLSDDDRDGTVNNQYRNQMTQDISRDRIINDRVRDQIVNEWDHNREIAERHHEYLNQVDPKPDAQGKPDQVSEANDVPQEGQITERQEEKPTGICVNDGGGDARGIGIQEVEISSYGSDAEYGFVSQSDYEQYKDQCLSREISSSGSSAWDGDGIAEELPNSSDVQDSERDFSTAFDEAREGSTETQEEDTEEDEDDKVMNRILEAVIERSEMVDQHARFNEKLERAKQQAELHEQLKIAEEQARINEELKMAEDQARLNQELKLAEEQARINQDLKKAEEQARINQELKRDEEQKRLEDEEFKKAEQRARLKQQFKIAEEQARLKEQIKIAEEQNKLKEQLKMAEEQAKVKEQFKIADQEARFNEYRKMTLHQPPVNDQLVLPERHEAGVLHVVKRSPRPKFYSVIRTPAMPIPDDPDPDTDLELDKLTASANVAKARAFALSSPFYTFCNKLSTLDQSEGFQMPNPKYTNLNSINPSAMASAAQESSSKPQYLRKLIHAEECAHPEEHNFGDEKVQVSMNTFSPPPSQKPAQTPEKKPDYLNSNKRLDSIWTSTPSLNRAALHTTAETEDSTTMSAEKSMKPGSSAASLIQPRNGLLRDNRGFANTTPTGNMPLSRGKNDTSASSRFKSSWE